jgi:ABC-type sulfate transport system permease subunit
MSEFYSALVTSTRLIVNFDPDLTEIVLLSLKVSLTAVALAAAIGLPLGAAVALFRFPGRGLVAALLNAFMGLPPVVVGLAVYLALSRSGPLGPLGLLFTPAAMIIAQSILITPIIAALARQPTPGRTTAGAGRAGVAQDVHAALGWSFQLTYGHPGRLWACQCGGRRDIDRRGQHQSRHARDDH